MKATLFWASLAVVCALPAFGQDIVVSSPANGATVGIPFTLTATTDYACDGQPLSAMGYSLDSGVTSFVFADSINTTVNTSTGYHTIHVKSWGPNNAACDVDVTFYASALAAAASYTDVAVSQPTANEEVVSPFNLSASGSQCQSQPISAFGYSLDGGATSFSIATWITAQVSASVGLHTLHVKSWGTQGSACDTDINVNVMPSPLAYVGSGAGTVSAIQTMGNWLTEFDTGTVGSSSGSSALTASPSLSGVSRYFYTVADYYAGQRYYVNFGADTSVQNFLYDTWVYITNSPGTIANLEFDTNQVMANGQTVIYGFQCDGWNGTWDYTYNAGTPTNYVDAWQLSSQPCNVNNWSQNTWHHVQVLYSRDAYGNVTYKSVWLDNAEQDIYVTVPSAFNLNWGSSLVTNFQVDSFTSGQSTSTVYLDNLTEYFW